MKLRIYLWLLVAATLLGACSGDELEIPEKKEPLDETVDVKKDVVLLCMGENDEVEKIAATLYDNIPVSWEIRRKTIEHYDREMTPERFEEAVRDPGIYLTVILNIDDVVKGRYTAAQFRLLKYYKRDFYIIADGDATEQKAAMLSLVGVYMEPGYYAINYDNVQHYRIFPKEDPHALENMIGKAAASQQLRAKTMPVLGADSGDFVPDPGYNAQMADKEALKQIEIYNRLYAYDEGEMNYGMEKHPYATKNGIPAPVTIDNAWTISAYNFQIYSKNNNCILSISNTTGGGFSAQIRDHTTPKGINVYAYLWNLLQEASSEVTVHADGGVFREVSYQPQTVVHGASYTENSYWKVSVAVSPVQLAERPWQAFKASFGKESSTTVSYKTESMSVTCRGNAGSGLYGKRWQFTPGEFYDRGEAFVYESHGGRMIDAQQAMTTNYVFARGWTLKQNYLEHINNSMKLFRQQCIYTLEADAQPGLVGVTLTDAMKLQKTKVHYNCGIRYGHESAVTDVSMSKTVWIDFNCWDN